MVHVCIILQMYIERIIGRHDISSCLTYLYNYWCIEKKIRLLKKIHVSFIEELSHPCMDFICYMYITWKDPCMTPFFACIVFPLEIGCRGFPAHSTRRAMTDITICILWNNNNIKTPPYKVVSPKERCSDPINQYRKLKRTLWINFNNCFLFLFSCNIFIACIMDMVFIYFNFQQITGYRNKYRTMYINVYQKNNY